MNFSEKPYVWGLLEAIGAIGLSAILLFGLTRCSSLTELPTQTLKTETLYRRDMIITVNGVAREGLVVVPMRDENEVHVEAAGDLDLFVMANCAGEKVKPKAWNVSVTVKSGLFGWGRKTIEEKRQVDFTYRPTGMETLGACPLQLYGFSKDGKHSWGFIDFVTDTFTLKGMMVCNGETVPFDRVMACQSRAGLYQQISFNEEVFMSPDPGCELDKSEGKSFTFQMPKGMCVYRIKSKSSGALGKMTLIGYDGILIRE